ncbi:MAG: hypothetical protein NUV34_06100, partial [Sulfuricaulis sp.]|nr:hypothetical protein [Sulfuricaulis sp.]
QVRFKRQETPPEPELRDMIMQHGFSVANLSYQLSDEGKVFEYQMTIRAKGKESYRRLAETLTALEKVMEFHIYPTGD